jgi:hypothetical protein
VTRLSTWSTVSVSTRLVPKCGGIDDDGDVGVAGSGRSNTVGVAGSRRSNTVGSSPRRSCADVVAALVQVTAGVTASPPPRYPRRPPILGGFERSRCQVRAIAVRKY